MMVWVEVAILGVILLAMLWFFCRCVHAWEFVDKTELPSRLKEMGERLASQLVWDSDVMCAAKKWVIIVIRCPKCGAAKVFRESN